MTPLLLLLLLSLWLQVHTAIPQISVYTLSVHGSSTGSSPFSRTRNNRNIKVCHTDVVGRVVLPALLPVGKNASLK